MIGTTPYASPLCQDLMSILTTQHGMGVNNETLIEHYFARLISSRNLSKSEK